MKRGAVIGLVAGAAAIVLAAAGGAIWVLTRPPGPEETADAYLRALSEGDADAVVALLQGELPTDDADRITTSFRGASGYLSDYSFELTGDGGGSRSVRAEVNLGDQPGVVGFALALAVGRWHVSADFLATIEVTTTLGDAVLIGGALTPVARGATVLPAVYSVQAAPVGLLTGEATAVATTEHPVQLAVAASVTPDATTRAQRQLDGYAASCTVAAAAVPTNCGLRIPWAADLATLSGVAYRVEQTPVLALAADGASFDATGGVVVATATGTTADGATASFTYRADDWALRGTVAFTGDEMMLAVR